jgi:two-component system response regulator PilR (NtrC family)
VVDDELGMREMLSIFLKRGGHSVVVESNGLKGRKRIEAEEPFDLVITDLVMPGADGMEVLAAAKRRCADTQVIVITAYASNESAVQAMQSGAYDYIMKPFKTEEMRLLVERALEKCRLLRENIDLRSKVSGRFEIGNLVGASRAMQQIVEICRRVGALRTNVLITGESGTGKELVARAIHFLSPRSCGPFVTANCGALPESLMESELFGHERGAFTGAVRKSEGLFREAEGGTLFLDEISEIPLAVQVKLLRAIQEHAVRPVGGAAEASVDARIIAASNRDLELDVAEGRFRSDLFYRLNVVHIDVPPLRERREDIPVLIGRFLDRFSRESGRHVTGFAPEATKALLEYSYPGNVRELENVVERAVALGSSAVIGLDALPDAITGKLTPPPAGFAISDGGIDLDAQLAVVERGFIEEALKQSGGVQTRAAELLGISFRSFRYRVRKLGLDGETK